MGGGLRLTPHHPVCIDGLWRFPAELAPVSEFPCDSVYSFVLQGFPSMLIGGVSCIGLGHGLGAGAAKHAYFGTELVIRDLSVLPGFAAGRITLTPSSFRRDVVTGFICSITEEPESPEQCLVGSIASSL